MSDRAPGYQRFFAELKRRRVFRVMAVYGVVGFVLLQVVDLAVPALLLPEWTYRLVALLLLLGFPVAILLAWAFELTPEGVRKTADPSPGELTEILAAPAARRWPSGVLALVGMTALLAGAWYVGRQSTSSAENAVAEETAPAAETAGQERLSGDTSGVDDRPSIAVLPFLDLSPAGDQEYFSDGITEEILNVLSKIDGLRVTARTSAFAYKGTNRDLREVGRELDVDYLIEGSVRKAGDQLRITAQLIDAADNSHLWSDTYDRRLENVFEIQSEIAEAISDELRIPLGLETGETLVAPTGDLEAYDLYLAARGRMRERGLEGITEATKLFEAALARDSAWAPAWAGLAESRALLPFYAADGRESGDSTIWRQSLEGAEEAARRALAIDPRNASARVALGNVLRDRFAWEPATREYLHAIELDPDNAEAHQQYAELLFQTGRLAESSVAAARAVGLDRSSIKLNVYGWSLWQNGRPEEAVGIWEEALRLDPEARVHYVPTSIAHALLLEGRYEEGLRRLGALLGDSTAYRLAGEALASGDAGPLERYVQDRPGTRPAPSVWVAVGRPERAVETLVDRIRRRPYGGGQVTFLWEPAAAPILDDPTIQDVYLPAVNLRGRTPDRLPPEAPTPRP